jgi:AcrR family transcriptional regulator
MTASPATEQVSTAPCDPAKPLRADARRNREKLIEQAAATFAAEGVDAPLEDIARSACVGIGTLYRHFPTREDLVLAVYYLEVDKLCTSAADRLGQDQPIDALSGWMHDFVAYVAAKRGLAACMRSMMQKNTGLFDQTRSNLNAAADSLLRAAADAGDIRTDVTGQELLRAMGGICMANDADDWQTHATQLLGLLLDGLRYRAPTPA